MFGALSLIPTGYVCIIAVCSSLCLMPGHMRRARPQTFSNQREKKNLLRVGGRARKLVSVAVRNTCVSLCNTFMHLEGGVGQHYPRGQFGTSGYHEISPTLFCLPPLKFPVDMFGALSPIPTGYVCIIAVCSSLCLMPGHMRRARPQTFNHEREKKNLLPVGGRARKLVSVATVAVATGKGAKTEARLKLD